jgi:hypothetical protein
MSLNPKKKASDDANVDTIEQSEQTMSSDTEKSIPEDGEGMITFKTNMAVLVRHSSLITAYQTLTKNIGSHPAYRKAGWRSCCWWCFAWELVTAVMLFLFYHSPTFETKHEEDRKSKMQLVREIDYVGLLLFTAGCLLILLALNWGGGM